MKEYLNKMKGSIYLWFRNLSIKFSLFFRNLSAKFVFKRTLEVFGSLFLLFEVLVFFNEQSLAIRLKSFWWIFLLFGLLVIILTSLPKLKYVFKDENKDFILKIVIGSIWNQKGTIVIPVNNKFDFINNGMTKGNTSVIQQLIKNNFQNNHQRLQTFIDPYLQNEIYEKKKIDPDSGVYPFGTTLKVDIENRDYYLVCTSKLNEMDRSSTSISELRESLNGFWSYLSQNGVKDDLVLPIIGSGRGRIKMPRRELIKEIANSYYQFDSSIAFCNSLTICIYENDLDKLFYFDELKHYLEWATKNS